MVAKKIKSMVMLLLVLLLVSCGDSNKSFDAEALDKKLTAELKRLGVEPQSTEQVKKFDEKIYTEFCFVESKVLGESNECSASGDGLAVGDFDPKKMNHTVGLDIRHKDLKEIGLSSIGISYNVLDEVPRFTVGTFPVEETSDFLNPKRATKTGIFLSAGDRDRKKPKYFIMEVDKSLVMNSPFYTPETYPDFSIKSGSLVINSVKELEPYEHSVRVASALGGIAGRQYITGQLNVELEKFGPDGSDLKASYRFGVIAKWLHVSKPE